MNTPAPPAPSIPLTAAISILLSSGFVLGFVALTWPDRNLLVRAGGCVAALMTLVAFVAIGQSGRHGKHARATFGQQLTSITVGRARSTGQMVGIDNLGGVHPLDEGQERMPSLARTYKADDAPAGPVADLFAGLRLSDDPEPSAGRTEPDDLSIGHLAQRVEDIDRRLVGLGEVVAEQSDLMTRALGQLRREVERIDRVFPEAARHA